MKAWFFDAVTSIPERKLFGPLRWKLLSQLRGAIVEVGAGTGRSFKYYPSDCSVIAIEPDYDFYRKALTRASQARAAIGVLRSDDGAMAALFPASCDAVVFQFTLCSIEKPATALKQARRILTESGRLIILEHVRSEGRIGRTQDFFTPVWQRIACNCHLNRETAGAFASRRVRYDGA